MNSSFGELFLIGSRFLGIIFFVDLEKMYKKLMIL